MSILSNIEALLFRSKSVSPSSDEQPSPGAGWGSEVIFSDLREFRDALISQMLWSPASAQALGGAMKQLCVVTGESESALPHEGEARYLAGLILDAYVSGEEQPLSNDEADVVLRAIAPEDLASYEDLTRRDLLTKSQRKMEKEFKQWLGEYPDDF